MYRTGNRLFLKQTVLIRSLLTSMSAMIKVVVQDTKLCIVQQSRGFYHYHVYCYITMYTVTMVTMVVITMDTITMVTVDTITMYTVTMYTVKTRTNQVGD